MSCDIFPFMDKPAERAPMFPTSEMFKRIGKAEGQLDAHDHHYRAGFMLARNFYEAKITSGELRVVKKATILFFGHKSLHNNCGEPDDACSLCGCSVMGERHNFCPGCGAEIVK